MFKKVQSPRWHFSQENKTNSINESQSIHYTTLLEWRKNPCGHLTDTKKNFFKCNTLSWEKYLQKQNRKELPQSENRHLWTPNS